MHNLTRGLYMGAQAFYASGFGIDSKSVYTEVCEQEIDNGIHPNDLRHKGFLKKLPLPVGANAKNIYKFVKTQTNSNDYCDKYGPMLYFEIPNARTVEVSVPASVIMEKNNSKGVKKWETIYTLKFLEFFHGNYRDSTKDFKSIVDASKYAKELAMKGIESKLDISKKLSDPKLVNLAKFVVKYKKIKQKQSLFVFFGMFPT